jgi:hypothetical protein
MSLQTTITSDVLANQDGVLSRTIAETSKKSPLFSRSLKTDSGRYMLPWGDRGSEVPDEETKVFEKGRSEPSQLSLVAVDSPTGADHACRRG